MAITITGASGNVINLLDATGRDTAVATALQTEINTAIANGTAATFDLDSDITNTDSNVQNVGLATVAATYTLPSSTNYVVVGGDNDSLSGSVQLDSNGLSSNNISILAGNTGSVIYNASNEKGTIINTGSGLTFNGAGKTGAWVIYSGNGASTITTTNGNNQINTGTGKNTITLGTGNNSVYSQGQDTITGGGDGYQSITLTGSKSDVTLNANSLITDIGSNNTLSVGKNSTINGGASATVTFSEGDQNVFQGGNNNTVAAVNSDLKVVHTTDSTFTVSNTLTFLNGDGTVSLTANGQLVAFGATASNYTINASGDSSGLFVADKGNETLNASGSTTALQIYANTVSGAQTNFVATGGSTNDTLVAGTGNATFSGGGGDNLFMFTKDTSQNGNTVITDFASSSQNKIALYNYGLDSSSLTELLKNSQNDTSGNAVLNLTGHTITIEGVSVSDLNVSQFEVANTTTTA